MFSSEGKIEPEYGMLSSWNSAIFDSAQISAGQVFSDSKIVYARGDAMNVAPYIVTQPRRTQKRATPVTEHICIV